MTVLGALGSLEGSKRGRRRTHDLGHSKCLGELLIVKNIQHTKQHSMCC